MKIVNTTLVLVVLLTTLGIWGCTETKLSPRASARIRHLENRNDRMEEDYQAAVEECMQLRKQLADAGAQFKRLQTRQQEQVQLLQTITTERDSLRDKLHVCTDQRDVLQADLTQFSRDLQMFAGKVQQIAANRQPSIAASAVDAQASQ